MKIGIARIRHSLVGLLAFLLAGSLALAQTQGPAPSPEGVSRPRYMVNFTRLQPGGPVLLDVSTVLRDSAGNPMTGQVKVTFSLHETETDRDPLWSEAQKVQVYGQGVILAFVGAFHPHGLPMELFRSERVSWLALQVDGKEQHPRLPVGQMYPALYSGFLDDQYKLELRAAEMEAKGEDGSALRDNFQRALGFTDAEFAIIRDTNQRLRSELEQILAEMKAITGDWGNQAPTGPHPTRAEVAAIVAQRRAHMQQLSPEEKKKLRDLSRQRGEAIRRAADDLRVALGPELAARLDAFLEAGIRVGCSAIGKSLPPGPNDPQHPCGSGRNQPAMEETDQ
jgi:ElaB/YqjD/DUF883 family membrane-anchored ribosome-binding protein